MHNNQSNPPDMVSHNVKVGRNDPCYCGSLKKYKKCCLDKDRGTYASDTITSIRREGLIEKLQAFAFQNFEKDMKKAKKIFFINNIFKDPDKAFEENYLHQGIFLEWFLMDYIGKNMEKTICESYYYDYDDNLTESEEEMLEGLMRSYRCLYEIQEIIPEKGINIKNIFTGKTIFVNERRGTRSLQKWDIIYARILKEEIKTTFSGEAIMFPRQILEEYKEQIRNTKKKYKIRSWSEFFKNAGWQIYLFLCRLENNLPKQKMSTTTGEDLVFCKNRYQVKNYDDTLKKFEEDKDLIDADENDGESVYLWLNDERTILASFSISKEELVIETKAIERMQAVEKNFANILKNMKLIERSEENLENVEKDLDDNEAYLEDISISKKDEEVMKEFYENHYKKWFDVPIPMLDDKTPREAARTKKGKKQLVELLKYYEQSNADQKKQGNYVYDINILRKKLGLR